MMSTGLCPLIHSLHPFELSRETVYSMQSGVRRLVARTKYILHFVDRSFALDADMFRTACLRP